MHKNYETIKSFNVVRWLDFVRQRSNMMKEEVESNSKEYILGVNEEEYKNYLFEKYYLHPLEIDPATEERNVTTSKEWIEDNWGDRSQKDVYYFTVKYKFKGTGLLFAVQPDSWVMTSYPIHGSESDSTIAFDFKLYDKDEKRI